jgi:hypothetical protein
LIGEGTEVAIDIVGAAQTEIAAQFVLRQFDFWSLIALVDGLGNGHGYLLVLVRFQLG